MKIEINNVIIISMPLQLTSIWKAYYLLYENPIITYESLQKQNKQGKIKPKQSADYIKSMAAIVSTRSRSEQYTLRLWLG